MFKKLVLAAVLLALPFIPPARASIDALGTPQPYATLATVCNSDHTGSIATITDGPANPSWNQVVTGGGASATVAIYCDGTAWKVVSGGGATQSPTGGVLSAPSTNQGNYGTGCAGTSCLNFDEHWAASNLDSSKWFPGLIINNQYINGGIGLTNPYSAWTICNCNGGTQTVFFDYSFAQQSNLVSANFVPLQKANDGSLQFTLGLNNHFAAQGATYIGAAISSAYTGATEIPASGGLMQWRQKFDSGLQYGAYPGMQCSASGAHFPTDSGTTYNANFEFGYTWTGTPLTDVSFGVNNVTASSGNGNGTSATGVYQVPLNNDLTNWHTFALEYTGDTTKKWQFYVDGVLRDTATASQPNGTVFNCSWQLFNAPSADSTWRSVPDPNNPGPFSTYISDIQFYRRPNT